MSHNPNIAFIDLLFILVMLLTLVVNIPAKSEASKPIADYTLWVSWQDGLNTDIDTHVLLPNRTTVWFRAKDRGTVTLERDDLGTTYTNYINQEIVAFRSPEDGEYIVTIRNYRGEAVGDVVIELTNRNGHSIYNRVVPMPVHKEEVGIMRIVIEDGKVVETTDTDRLIIRTGEVFHD